MKKLIVSILLISWGAVAFAQAPVPPPTAENQVLSGVTSGIAYRWVAQTLADAGIQPAISGTVDGTLAVYNATSGAWEEAGGGLVFGDGDLVVPFGGIAIGKSSAITGVGIDVSGKDIYIIGGTNRRFLVGEGSSVGEYAGFRWDNVTNTVSFGHSGANNDLRNVIVDAGGYTTLSSGMATSGEIDDVLTLTNEATGADGGGVRIVAKGKRATDDDYEFGDVYWKYTDESTPTVEAGISGADHYRRDGLIIDDDDARTIADSGDGNAATLTLTPTTSYVELTCSDSDGCDITMGESGMSQGMKLEVINVSANACNFADTSGVSETSGAVALGQYDVIGFRYISDRWVMTYTTDN